MLIEELFIFWIYLFKVANYHEQKSREIWWENVSGWKSTIFLLLFWPKKIWIKGCHLELENSHFIRPNMYKKHWKKVGSKMFTQLVTFVLFRKCWTISNRCEMCENSHKRARITLSLCDFTQKEVELLSQMCFDWKIMLFSTNCHF